PMGEREEEATSEEEASEGRGLARSGSGDGGRRRRSGASGGAPIHAVAEGCCDRARGGARRECGVGEARDQSVFDLRLDEAGGAGGPRKGPIADERPRSSGDRGAAGSRDLERMA